MTEYVDISVSDFIVITCQMLPKSFPVLSDHMHDLIPSAEPEPKEYSIFCGSAAEFYIRPLNSCIDDTDFLTTSAEDLAFSGNVPILPCDMSGLADTIQCYKIESYRIYPSFVRLRIWGKMIYDWKYKKYEFCHTTFKNDYMAFNMDAIANTYSPTTLGGKASTNIIRGPAITCMTDTGYSFKTDTVTSVWCPEWPKEAQGWLKRYRNYGWPTIDTIAHVTRNGCHVVYIQHRCCRDDKGQWRLSFSIAEVVLLQSWTQTQQIVYHLLRFLAKRELIQKDCLKEDEVLCTYHLKTLMLWTCEEMSPEWWNSSSVITICCELLKTLAEWLKRRYCPNYFIPGANLFHEPSSSTMLHQTERRLNDFVNSGILCHWFGSNYVQPSIRIDLILGDKIELVDYMLTLFEFWKKSELKSLDSLFSSSISCSHKNIRCVIKYGFYSGMRMSFKDQYVARCLVLKTNSEPRDLPAIEKVLCFTYYDILLFILHTAYGLRCGEISWDSSLFVEFVNAISLHPTNVRSQYHNFPKACGAQSSRFHFLCAQHLMENLTGSNGRAEIQLLSLMSKEFLRRALQNGDSTSNEIAHVALVYLSALHFASSEYQLAIDFCCPVLGDQISQKDKETLNAGCLLFIDDVARIVGLCVLHQKITSNKLHFTNRRLYLDLRLSPKVFAYYLTELSAEKISTHLEFYHGLPDSAFPIDDYLKALLKSKSAVSMKSGTRIKAARQRVCRRTDLLAEVEDTNVNPLIVKETVIDALMEIALENMTSFYNVIRKDFGIQCNTIDCYRALHLYKCRQYDQVMHLCERILKGPDLRSDLKELALENVFVIPPLDSFFDEDVQSLLGIHTLFYYLSPLNDYLRNVELSDESTFAHWFAHAMAGHQCEFSCLFLFQCSFKYHYFLGRHFVARYLKARCCIDCNLPYKDAMTEFAAQKTNLPFEHIIRRFILRKLRVIKR